MSMKILVAIKKCNYSFKSNYYDDSNKLVIGKMKDENGGVVIEEFFGLKSKMYSFLVYKSEHKEVWIETLLQQ